MIYSYINDSLLNDVIYSRDVSGRELAIYENTSLLEYPFYGLDMIGKLKNDELHFYLKDHLGSVRAVVQDDKILSSQDYDAWGYILEGRTYQSEEGKFKFTGKERDEESFYDYFGARYYDSRIGRWGSVEPLQSFYLQYSPYTYGLLNPIHYIDSNGKDATITINGNKIEISFTFNYSDYSDTNPRGLNSTQEATMYELAENIEDYWSGTFEINGKEYEVSTKVSYKKFSTLDKAASSAKKYEGGNVVRNIDRKYEKIGDKGVGAIRSNLILDSGKNLKPDSDTGAHEASHLLGLKGDDPNDDSISGYARPRNRPTGPDFEKIFKSSNIDLNSNKKQIIKGYEKED